MYFLKPHRHHQEPSVGIETARILQKRNGNMSNKVNFSSLSKHHCCIARQKIIILTLFGWIHSRVRWILKMREIWNIGMACTIRYHNENILNTIFPDRHLTVLLLPLSHTFSRFIGMVKILMRLVAYHYYSKRDTIVRWEKLMCRNMLPEAFQCLTKR
jgi:hypothetical protein